MEEECDMMDIQLKGLSLIDFSSENDDSLILDSTSPLSATTSSPHHPQFSENQKESHNFESLGSLGSGKEAGMIPSTAQDGKLSDLNDSLGRRKGKCNLRKSLAWDSAFFTNAGFLDPEELSCMIKGAEKSEKQMLPGIQEDVQRSTDSLSTLESDNLTLENLEAELFEDIRASIQKSSKAFNTTNANGKATSGESQAISSMKKMDRASQNQQPALKKPMGISKSQTKQTPKMQGTVKILKQDSVQSQVAQSIVRTRDSNPTLPKPHRTSNKEKSISTATAKRASLAASQANKSGNDNTTIVAGKGAPASKAPPILSGARRVLPKPSSSSKFSSLGSSNSTKTTPATSSSADSSRSVSSDNIGKSHLAAVQRKAGGDRPINPPPSVSTLKTPSKTATRNKTTYGNSAVSAYLMSSKISSSISPASSISEWSSTSSSSSCTINLRSNKSRTSFDTSSCRSLDNEAVPSDSNNHSNGQILDEHEREGIAKPNGSTKKSSTQTGKLSRPGSVRPSGLRLPSPKIGYFDGMKSVRTPDGAMHSFASLTMLPKIGAAIHSPNRNSNMKPKVGKTSHARTVSALAKVNPHQPTSPMSSGEKLHASVNASTVTSDMEGCVTSSLEVNDETISGESCLKVEEVGGEGSHQAKLVAAADFGAVMNDNLGVPFLRREMNLDKDGIACLKAYKTVALGDSCDPNTECKEIVRPSKRVDKDVRDGQDSLKSIVPAFLRTNEKENVVFGEHVDEINKNSGAAK